MKVSISFKRLCLVYSGTRVGLNLLFVLFFGGGVVWIIMWSFQAQTWCTPLSPLNHGSPALHSVKLVHDEDQLELFLYLNTKVNPEKKLSMLVSYIDVTFTTTFASISFQTNKEKINPFHTLSFHSMCSSPKSQNRLFMPAFISGVQI